MCETAVMFDLPRFGSGHNVGDGSVPPWGVATPEGFNSECSLPFGVIFVSLFLSWFEMEGNSGVLPTQ